MKCECPQPCVDINCKCGACRAENKGIKKISGNLKDNIDNIRIKPSKQPKPKE